MAITHGLLLFATGLEEEPAAPGDKDGKTKEDDKKGDIKEGESGMSTCL
jgi:hypothetical protein